MLTKFTVENFKSFDKPLTFDLGHPGSYEFNTEAVRDGVVTKAMVYGFNGCGKSNLGLAMLDIVTHLTDKERMTYRYVHYQNLDSEEAKPTTFEYCFRFDETEVVYRYQKRNVNALLLESLSIGGAEVLRYDFTTHKGFVRLEGAETLNLNSDNSNISRVKFVRSNSILKTNNESRAFQRFMDFVDGMLLFYSLDENGYQGFTSGSGNIEQFIMEKGKVKEFEHFLQENNVDIHLTTLKSVDGREQFLVAAFKNKQVLVSFEGVASTGTKSLSLFYYWKLIMDGVNGSSPKFVFMDEFDAFYHFELAESVVKLVTQSFPDTQVIFTTHNTDLLSNDILRPDCYFLLHDSSIRPLCDLTDTDIRKAHNLQRMFKAGDFQEGGDYE